MKNHYEKYLAATELKKKGWRFNKSYSCWFKRQKAPVESNDLYEIGNFWFFDFQTNWEKKERKNFKFEYKDLEEEI